MKNVKFAALNLEAVLPDSCFYFDGGYVISLDKLRNLPTYTI
jgi:hypothetical protein